jgi:hypothetical protein
MTYARFGKNCNWYIYWAESGACSPEAELLELLRAQDLRRPFAVTYNDAKKFLSGHELPFLGDSLSPEDVEILKGAFVEFLADVDKAYSSSSGTEESGCAKR